MILGLQRIIKWGWQGFLRNSTAFFATTMIMVVVLSLIVFLFLFQKVKSFLVEKLEEKVSLSVYFKRDVPEEEILRAKRELSLVPAIQSIEYVSKEQALKEFKERHSKNPLLMESLAMIGFNPLLSYLEIQTKDPSQYQKIVNFLKKESSFASLVDHINFFEQKPVIQKIEKITSNLTNLGIFITFLLGISAFLVAFNTIKLAILNFQDEISIMRLVGASNWSIRAPLFFQGGICVFFATLISLAFFLFFIFLFNQKIKDLLFGFDLFHFFVHHLFEIFLLQFGIGIFLVFLANFLATRKYLQV